jgi:hypothetical protein
MLVFRSSDLQRQLGDVQRAGDKEPVLFEHHGKARSVMMSVAEFMRLKTKAGEPARVASDRRALVQRGLPADPLGYDTSDFEACVTEMARAALSGRNKAAVRAEIDAVERRLGMRAGGRA